MALAINDRVQQTGTANTTVSFTLSGAVVGFQSFAVIGNGNTTYYSAFDASGNWEVGLGTYSTTGPTLTRNTVYSSSNSNTAVTFSGPVNVFVTYPSEKSINLDASGNATALGTITSGVWNGSTIPVAYGGTGVTSSSGANSVVLRDASVNAYANNFVASFQSITAAAGVTTLTVASAYFQRVIGSTSQTIKFPDATTLQTGHAFIVDADCTDGVYIQDGSGTQIEFVPSGGIHYFFVESNATVAGSWGRYSWIPANIEWGTNTLDLSTTVISNGTWQGGTIQSGYGGTGLTTFVGANNALYSTGASTLTAGTLPILAGGTGSTTASGARSNLGAAASGANSDITSLSGLTTPLSVGQGGTGLSSVTANRILYGNGTSALNTNVNFTYDGTTLLVGDSGGLAGATNPVISSVGGANNYVQSYIYNTTNDVNSSADFTAYPSNGSDASGWVDMGITSLNFNQAAFSVTGPNEAYLFGSSPSTASTSVTGNLVYATDSYGSQNAHQWYVGGFSQSKSAWKMQLTSTGLQLANALGTAYGGTGNTSGQAASVANALTSGTGISFSSGTTYNGSAAITINNSSPMVYPSGSGIAVVSSGASWGTTLAAPSGSIVGTTDTQTLTNKRVTARVQGTTSASTITPTGDSSDQYNVTALATTAVFAIPSGTPTDGQKLSIRILAPTTQTISWTTTAGGYRVIGTTLPTSAPAGKTIYVGCVYNAADTFWDVVAVATQA